MIDKTWLKRLIVGNTYEKTYPDINNSNVFSCSTLAYDVNKQVDWKIYGAREYSPNYRMFYGKAIHKYIQTHLPKTYIREKEIRVPFPFEWQDSRLSGFTVMGHIDAFSVSDKQILEFKTSMSGRTMYEITDYHKRQAAFYHYALTLQEIEISKVTIIKIAGEKAIIHNLTDIEIFKHSHELIRRANECARKLDSFFGSDYKAALERVRSNFS